MTRTPTTDARQMLADLQKTLALVWEASPLHATVVLVSSLLQAFAPAATLWVSKLLLDAVALASQQKLEGGLGTLSNLLILQVLVGALVVLLGTFQGASRELLGDSLQNKITRKILQKSANLEVEQFENAKTYDALKNAYNEVGFRPIGVATQVLGLLQAVITLTSIGVLLAQLGWLVLLLTLVATLPGVLVSNRFGAESYRMVRRRTPDARVQNYLGALLTSDQLVKEVRLFSFEPYLLQRWQEYYQKFRVQLVPLITRRSAWSFAASLLSSLLIGVATFSVLVRASEGRITVGDFAMFVGGLGQVQGQFSNLLSGVSGIYQNLLYMRNLFEFLELPQRDLDAGLVWNEPIQSIEFEHVAFRYPLTERDVLKDISFKVSRGQALALVGENGAGKTTIVKLLTRLFEPTSGRILLNGKDAAHYSPRSVQQQMSIVFQDYGQYQMTARENVALGQLSAISDDAAVQRAGEQSGANEFVQDLPNGYDTMLGRMFEGGRQLSGGQWQRLALSRLYFRQASVLVFDEPTAALDAQAEFNTIEALREQSKDRITVLISHRFSTVRLADQIVVLEHGLVQESGSHAVLLEQGGIYAALFRLQARGFE
ncbi:MAG: ABC transporter ATP-binding protein [Deinococcales bacterium]